MDENILGLTDTESAIAEGSIFYGWIPPAIKSLSRLVHPTISASFPRAIANSLFN
jgi:hypothetical protein